MGLIIFGIIILIKSGVLFAIGTKSNSTIICAIAGVMTGIGTFLIITAYNEKPKAIDVYRGNTTLQITYEDGVPVDSVVVFKEK